MDDTGYWLRKTTIPEPLCHAVGPYYNRDLTLLDLGCAGGRLAVGFLPYFREVYAIDRSERLVRAAEALYPRIHFQLGDFEDPKIWIRVDVVVSNCALRRDYCSLAKVAKLCIENCHVAALRVQGVRDLETILPQEQRRSLFFDREEILSAFGVALEVEEEYYPQRFSSVEYVRQFLQRINVPYQGVPHLTLPRHYYTVRRCYGRNH